MCIVELVIAAGIFLSLTGVSLPRSIRAAQDDDAAACRAIELEVRAAVAHWFYGKRDARGGGRFPTLEELSTPGLVLSDRLPANPLGGAEPSAVRRADGEGSGASHRRTGESGWAYDEQTGEFWSDVDASGPHEQLP